MANLQPTAPVKLIEIGILIVVILQGRNLPDKHTFSKQDPYVVCALDNGSSLTTKTDVGGGQHPTWDEELRFTVMSAGEKVKNILKLSVYAKELGEDDLLGIGEVEIDRKWPENQFDDWVSISVNGKPKGEIFLEMTFYPVDPPLVKPTPHLPPRVQVSVLNLTRRPSRYTPAERLARPLFNTNQHLLPHPHPHPHPHSQHATTASPTHFSQHSQTNYQSENQPRIQQHQPYLQNQGASSSQSHLPFPGEAEPEIPLSLRVGRLSLEGVSPSQHPHQQQQYEHPNNHYQTKIQLDPRLTQPSHSPVQNQVDPTYRSYSPVVSASSAYPPGPYYPHYQPQQSQPYQYPPQNSGPSPPPILQHTSRPLPVPPVISSSKIPQAQQHSQLYHPQQQQQYAPQSQSYLSPLSPPVLTSSPYRPPQQQQSYLPPVPPRPISSNSNLTIDTRRPSQSQSPPPRPPKTPIIPPKIPISSPNVSTSAQSLERPILPPPVHYSSSPHLTTSSTSSSLAKIGAVPPRVTSLPSASTASRPSPSSIPTQPIIHAGQASLALRIEQERSDALYANTLASSIAKSEKERELLARKKEKEREERDWKVAESLRIEEEKFEKEEVEKRRKCEEDDERLARELAES